MSDEAMSPSRLYGPWRGRWRCTPEVMSARNLPHLYTQTIASYAQIRAALAQQFGEASAPERSVIRGFCEVCWGLVAERRDIVADDKAPLGRRSEQYYW